MRLTNTRISFVLIFIVYLAVDISMLHEVQAPTLGLAFAVFDALWLLGGLVSLYGILKGSRIPSNRTRRGSVRLWTDTISSEG